MLFEPFGEIVSCKVFDSEVPTSEDDDTNDEEQKMNPGKVQRGYGFVCFSRCEDARKALEYFHEKGDESSVSIEMSSKGGDQETAPNSAHLLQQ